MNKIGWHTSIKSLLQAPDEFFKENQTFQVFVGTPKRLTIPSYEGLFSLKEKRPSIDIVVHTPYVVSLCKNPAENITQATMNYYITMAKKLNECGVKYMVTHIGGLKEGDTAKLGAVYIYDFCVKWLSATSECSTVLCLENDTGSKSGTKMGNIKILAAIVQKINSPRIRICLDTEHAYGAGFDLLDVSKLEVLNKYVDVVHFNSIPSYVDFGSHLDRHSTTSLDESKINQYIIYQKLFNGVRPFIFEVDGEPYISRNIRWLKEVSK